MRTRRMTVALAMGTAVVLAFSRAAAGASFTFTEEFTSTAKRDAATTATWDTTNGEVRLPSGSVAWDAVDGLAGKDVTAAAFSPAFASDRMVFAGIPDGILRSTDGGQTWARVAATGKMVTSIALSPTFASDGIGLAITNGGGLWRSTDRGETWAKVRATNGFRVAFSPSFAADRTAFAAGITSVVTSTDGGATWAASTEGMDGEVVTSGDIRGVAVSSAYATDRTVYAATFSFGVYKSTDGGQTWATANPASIEGPSASVVAAGSGTVAAAFLDGAYVSTDRGATWTLAVKGDVNDLAFAPDGAFLAATASGVTRWKAGATSAVAGSWPGGAGLSVAVAKTYPGSGSVIAGRSGGAAQTSVGFTSPAVAVSTAVDATADPFASAKLAVDADLPVGTSVMYQLSAVKGGDGKPVWEGPVTPGASWTFTTRGSELRWRATLTTTDTAVTPLVRRLTLAYESAPEAPPPEPPPPEPKALTAPTPTGAETTASSIRWTFTDTAADETGFEIHTGQHGTEEERVVATTRPKTVKDFTFLEEDGLAPNAQVCGRHAHALRGVEVSMPSPVFACAVTRAMAPGKLIVDGITETAVTLKIPADENPAGTEYSLIDAISKKFIGADGVFGKPVAWQVRVKWGDGKVRVTGLTAAAEYAFCAYARSRSPAFVRTACSPAMAVKTAAAARPPAPPAEVAVTITNPPAGAVLTDDLPITVTGRGTAGAAVAVSVDGGAATPGRVAAEGDFVVRIGALAEGEHAITARIGTKAASVHIRVTHIAEGAFRIEAPADGEALRFGERVIVHGIAPAGLSVQIGIDRLDAGAILADADGRFTFDAGVLAVGEHAIDVQVGTQEATIHIRVLAAGEEPPLPPPPGEEPPAPGEESEEPEEAPPGEERGEPGEEPPPPPGEEPEEPPEDIVTIESPEDGVTLEGTTVVVGGTANAGAVVAVRLDGSAVTSATAAGDGSFAVTLGAVAPGEHAIVARHGSASAEVRFAIAPPPSGGLVIGHPGDGSSSGAPAVVVSGRGPAETRVEVIIDDRPVGTVVTDAAGDFALVIPGPLADGEHTIRALATGGGGEPLEASVSFVHDGAPPPPPTLAGVAIVSRVASPTRPGVFDATLRIHGTMPLEAFDEVEAIIVTVESEPVTVLFRPADPSWEEEVTVPLAPGSHTVRLAARDAAGNVSTAVSASFDVPPSACADQRDNDGDGKIDHPADPDCASPFDDEEEHEGLVERAAEAVRDTSVATVKAVVRGTTATARATARVAEAAAVTVQRRVLDNPRVEVATERVVVPAVTIAVVANTATATAAQGFQLVAYLKHLLGLLIAPGRLLSRRKRKRWGIVYDGLSKRPVDLATVRLLGAGGKAAQTMVTDVQGRFAFLVKAAGTYRISVTHPRYEFPSQTVAKTAKEDAGYLDIYHGAAFEVGTSGADITVSIPVDPKAAIEARPEREVRRHVLRIVSEAVSASGLVFSLISFAITPRPVIGAILVLNVLLYLLFRRIALAARRPKSWGAVTDAATRQPLHLAVVRIFDQEFHKLLETAVTDRFGRYRFLVGKNVYELTAEKVGYERVKSKPIDLTRKEGIVGVDLALKPTGK